MLNIKVNNQGFTKLQDGLKDTLRTAGLLSEKTNEAGETIATLAKGFRTDGLKDYESKLTDIFKTVDAITENEKNLAEVQKQIATLGGNEKGKSVKSLQGTYAATKDPIKKEKAKADWEKAKQQLIDAETEETKLLVRQQELNATFDAQYKKVSYVCDAMNKVSTASSKTKANVEVMEDIYKDLNASVNNTANKEETAADSAEKLGTHTKEVADTATDADAAIGKVTGDLENAANAADNLKHKVAEANGEINDSATSAGKASATTDRVNEIKETLKEIYRLKSLGQDTSEQITKLGQILDTELGSKDRFDLTQLFLDTDEAIKYVKKDLTMSDVLRDEFNSIGDFFEQIRKKLNELNAEARKAGEPVVDAATEIEQNIQKINGTVIKIPTMRFDNDFDARKNIDELKTAMKSIVDMGMPIQLKDQYNLLKKAIDDSKEAQKRFNETANKPTAEQRLNTVAQVTSTTTSIDKAMKTQSATDNIAELIRRLNELNAAKKKLEELNLPKDADATYNRIIQLIAILNAQISEYKKKLTDTSKEHEKTKKTGTNFVKSLLSAFKTLKSSMSTINRTTGKVKSSFDSMARSMKSNFKHMITNITKYVLGFRSLFFLVRRLRKYIGEGIQNMAQFNDGNNHVNESITRLLSSLLYLKNAWATAFSPILQFVTPMLERLIDKMAEVGNAFSRFLGSLLGTTTVFQAVKVDAADYADSLDKAAGSAGSAADKTKKLTDRLAAFDDLNVLGKDNDPDGTGSGGGGGLADAYEPDPNEMFTLIDVGKEVLEQFKQMWEDADFTELGKNLKYKLITALLTAQENLEEFKEPAYKVGKSIITFLNGVFGDKTIWIEAGKTLGKTVNVVSEFIRGLLENNEVDWGGGLASLINGFFASTDWETIRANIVSFATQFKDNVISFLKTLDWEGDNGIFEAFKSLGSAIGTAISETVGDAEFMGSLGDALGKLISAILITWKAILDQNDGDEIGNALYEFFASLIDAINWDTLAENLSGSLVLLLNAISKLSENLSEDDTFQQALSDFVENLDLDTVFEALGRNISSSTVAANSIGSVLAETLGNKDVVNKVTDGLKTLIESIDYNSMVSSTVDFLGNLLGSALADPALPIKIAIAVVEGLINGLSTALSQWLEGGYEWAEEAGLARDGDGIGEQIVNGLIGGIAKAFEDDPLYNFFKEHFFDPTVKAIKDLFNIDSPSKEMETLGGYIGEGLLNGISNLMPNVEQIFTDFHEWLVSKWDEVKGDTYEKWVGIRTNVTEKAQELKDNAEEKVEALKTSLVGKWQEIKGSIYEKLVGIKTNVLEVFDQLKEGIKNPINGFIDIIEGMVNRVIDGINSLTSALNVLPDIQMTNPITGTEYTLGFTIPTLNSISIPRLAQGAVIPPNREFMAVLGDQSHGTNIEAPLDTIKQAVAEVIANNGNEEVINLLQQLITVVESKNLVIGDKEIGKANARYVNQQKLIRGTSI